MDVIMNLISLFIDRLFANPKKTIIFLFVSFIAILIIGESITTGKNIQEYKNSLPTPTMMKTANQFFTLGEVVDVSKTPTLTLTPRVKEATWTPQPYYKVTPTSIYDNVCEPSKDRNAVNVDKNAKITYLGGYPTSFNLRYRYYDPKVTTGTVESGEKVWIMNGPECLDGVRWWEVNSSKRRITGWLPEIINGRPVLEVVK